ncbi:hypothetical protein BAUCODRAFT_414935 [Baudoinia panamericana UAMH 10762]|uniref:Uncharacterized protein n=1 Tax=Baudoinia panamericana (strain UAMH 10762) TaxID=717646 RepID=M2NGP2_BAUPA|nr:uncharacterized protein BAUCODRAFT_414935 [Baudoinia panamericana UAMH 10762]EMC98170.1 hypothetical protein BAUCODRAFT_414935 [Baudoinia panamericana UAMH 10762]
MDTCLAQDLHSNMVPVTGSATSHMLHHVQWREWETASRAIATSGNLRAPIPA